MPTQNEIAEHLDLSQQEVSRHMAVMGIDWRSTSLDDIRVLYIRKVRAVAEDYTAPDGADLTRERVLTERVARELKQFALAEWKGRLVNLAQLDSELAQMVGAFRSELISLDGKLKATLDALYGIEIDPDLLAGHTKAALSQLARYNGPEREVPLTVPAIADPLFPNPEREISC